MNDGSQLHDQFRRAAAAITVEGGSADDVRTRLRAAQHRRVVARWSAAVAVVAVVAGAVALAAARHDDDSPTINPQHTIAVDYEKSVFHQKYALECRHGEIDRTGMFDDVTIETWSTPNQQHWRTLYSYPDGSTVEVVAEGGYYSTQTGLWSRGEPKLGKVGCLTVQPAGEDVLDWFWQGQAWVYQLNQPVENPERVDGAPLDTAGMPPPIATSPSGRRYYAMFDQATAVPGTFADSLGREASKLRLQWGDGKGDVWEWFRDPSTHRILEFAQHNDLDQVGTYVATMTVVESGRMMVAADLFDTQDLTEDSIPYSP